MTKTAEFADAKNNMVKGDTVTYTVAWKDGGVEKSKTITLTAKDGNGTLVDDGRE